MIYLLYNSKSNHGRALRAARKLKKKFEKKETVELQDILGISGKEKAFVSTKTKEDGIVLIGGDGTVDQFFNRIYPVEIQCRLFMYASGRGNDLARDYKKHGLFELTHLCNKLPLIKTNGTEQSVFINGVGMGVDSMVCQQQRDNAVAKVKESYFKISLRVFKTFKTYQLDLEVDNKSYHFNNVWFFVCNNGRYFGGGMKITPQAKREDDLLDICIVHNIKLWSLLMVFPLVFIGKHIWFRKKSITMLKGKHIIVKPLGCQTLQRDGEVLEGIEQIEIRR